MINVQQPAQNNTLALFRLGFRPFFLGAALFAIIAISLWFLFYTFQIRIPLTGMSPTIWHAHEMIFGYAMAVIAGFLLTGIKNWTGQQTLRGSGLAFLFGLWAIARILPVSGLNISTNIIALFDLSFMLLLFIAATIPILKVKQKAQIGIVSKLVLLLLANSVFYLGLAGLLENGVQWGLYSGLYLVIALVLVMARRVVPFFIKNGVDKEYEIKNWKIIDVLSLIFLVQLWIVDVFTSYTTLMSITAAILFVLHIIRMIGWYTHQIWKKPLLWVLFLAYGSIVSAFALQFAQLWFNISPFLAVHAFTYGGIGIMTIGMMSRVTLGHTGRNVFNPPAVLFWIFLILVVGTVFRVFIPLFNMQFYIYWIEISQALWIVAFTLFVITYAPMLWADRIDGKDG